jgi:hypothetical protein
MMSAANEKFLHFSSRNQQKYVRQWGIILASLPTAQKRIDYIDQCP